MLKTLFFLIHKMGGRNCPLWGSMFDPYPPAVTWHASRELRVSGYSCPEASAGATAGSCTRVDREWCRCKLQHSRCSRWTFRKKDLVMMAVVTAGNSPEKWGLKVCCDVFWLVSRLPIVLTRPMEIILDQGHHLWLPALYGCWLCGMGHQLQQSITISA